MSLVSKLKDLLVVRRGGGTTVLSPQKRYAIKADGALQEFAPDDKNFEVALADPTQLVMLGDRGDLRQLEVLTRNMSVLFNRMVDVNELYDIVPSALSAQVNAGQAYDFGGIAFCSEVRLKSSGAGKVSFDLMGSNNNASWELLEEAREFEFTSGAGALEKLMVRSDLPKYRYFKVVQREAGFPEEGFNEVGITGVVFLGRDKAVSKFFPVSEYGELEELAAEQYDMSVYIEGNPTVSQKLLVLVSPLALYLRANFDGFVVNVGTPPAADYVIAIHHNEEEIGTLTVLTNGAVAFSAIDRRLISPSDRIALVGAAESDESLADLSLTISLERADATAGGL